ncbi:MAG: flippase-like domain-containing protein [Candidatus Brocadia sp.]|nr:flippase-like domain-containing protein [Candidatus Brocadia sp.]
MKFSKKNMLFVVSIIVSIICTWFFIKNIDWLLLKNALTDANYWYIIPTLVLTLLVYVIRAIRWRGLLLHIKSVSVINLLSVTCIGFMANNILPARVGEVLRPFILTKKEDIKFSTSFATVIVERIFDMLGLIIFTVVVIALLPHSSDTGHTTLAQVSANQVNTVNESIIPSLKKWTEVFAVVGVFTVASLFLVVIRPDFFKKILSKLCSFLPHKLKEKILGLYESFVYGLKILENKMQTVWILALSLFIWVLGGAEIYLLGFSFHMHLPFVGACLVAVCLALAVALPQAPGYIGVFHIAILKSLHIFGIETTAAQSYAIVLWAISILPSTIMGFLFLWREGIAFREVIKLEEEIAEGKLEELEGVTKDIK